jgi:hypothetical protein
MPLITRLVPCGEFEFIMTVAHNNLSGQNLVVCLEWEVRVGCFFEFQLNSN